MLLRTLIFVSIVLSFSWFAMETPAQVFDRGSFGSANRQSNAESQNKMDQIFSDKFEAILERRQNTGFVGSAAGDGDFIGSQQPGATNVNVPSATAGIRADRDNSARINRPLPPLRQNQMYRPRLTIGFQPPEIPTEQRAGNLTELLQASPAVPSAESIVLTMKGRTVHLAGSVATVRERELASRILLFEPGVDAVHNELAVSPPIPGISP